MAKGNTVDAHRKALRKKELAKNKQNRTKAKEIAIVKKDTRSIEADIQRLQSAEGQLSAADKDELSSLRAELARVNKAKTEYVEKHPEHRKFVFPERGGDKAAIGGSNDPPGLFTKDGKLKDPKRSLYYDPVFNPYGAPPPGMPYRERPPSPSEFPEFQPIEDDSSDDDEDDDEDILMPEGPPPPPVDDSDDSDDSDDIPMPDGPPPPQARLRTAGINRVAIARPPTSGRPPQGRPQFFPQPFHPDPHMRHPPPQQHYRPPPRGFPPPQHVGLPPRPGGPTHVQDPLSDAPQQTYQAMQHARYNNAPAPPQPPSSAPPPPPPSSSVPLTSGPFLPVGASTAGSGASATISAAPVLRDLKAEATAFLPTHLRKKKQTSSSTSASSSSAAAVAGLGKIDAAMGSEAAAGGRASLMDALKDKGLGAEAEPPSQPAQKKRNRDYEQFQKDMEGFL